MTATPNLSHAPAGPSIWRTTRERLSSWRAELGVGVGLIVQICLFGAFAPNFLTLGNLTAVMTQTSVTAMVAVGMTFVIVTGEIDLSVGATVGLSGTLFALLVAQHGWPIGAALACAVAFAAVIGAAVGALRVIWQIPSFITTLGLLSALRGIGFYISDSSTIGPLPPALATLWFGTVFGVPMPVVLASGVVALGWLTLARTRFGRHVYATGGNPVTASRYGIPVQRIRFYVFIVVQVLAALGGILYVARLNGGSAGVGELLELDVIAAVIVGTVLGVLFVAVLRNGLVLMGVDPIVFMIAQGVVIVLAVWWSMAHRTGWHAE